MNISGHLAALRDQILVYATDFGLDPFPTIFEIIDYNEMNEIAAYGGFPNRYPHWRFGMDYERLIKSHIYGLSKIYEMVINNNPTYAYLMEGNNFVDQKTVIAHVYGHSDFFKHNFFFSKTNRRMIDEMANHATRVRRYIDRHGIDRVESFIDVCLSIDNLIDPHLPFKGPTRRRDEDEDEDKNAFRSAVPKIKSKGYMEDYINPKEFLDAEQKKLDEEAERLKRVPVNPEKDVLQFLVEHAPLEKWQSDVLSIIREEAYYFAPQGQTKIMNEGWATFWHSRIMTQKACEASEIIDYAQSYAGVVAVERGQFNPYKVGIELFRDIEERWDKGRFGKEWDECDDIGMRESWDRGTGLGKKKIFEVRKLYNDVTFIDEFLTEDFCRRNKLFTFAFNAKSGDWQIESRKFTEIKQKLLFQLTNFGQPLIYVRDANFDNRAELLLHHRHQDIDLRIDYAQDVLQNLFQIWSRPVNIETVREEKGVLLRFDGTEHSERSADYQPI
jgi:stage V sporulation protein R